MFKIFFASLPKLWTYSENLFYGLIKFNNFLSFRVKCEQNFCWIPQCNTDSDPKILDKNWRVRNSDSLEKPVIGSVWNSLSYTELQNHIYIIIISIDVGTCGPKG